MLRYKLYLRRVQSRILSKCCENTSCIIYIIYHGQYITHIYRTYINYVQPDNIMYYINLKNPWNGFNLCICVTLEENMRTIHGQRVTGVSNVVLQMHI